MTRSPLCLASATAWALLLGPAAGQDACQLVPAGSATVAGVRDGRTLMLADGRELRLAAIEAPAESRAALQALVGTGSLRLQTLGAGRDRYGRVVAFAFPAEGRESLQQALIEQGRARVSARAGSPGCASGLLAAERAARAARRGLWADPNFAPMRADNPTRIQAELGHFALIEGKVLSVRESGATIYVNFGRRWTRGFTVIILRRLGRSFAAAGMDPKTLAGRRIRVRGFIEHRGGPAIEASHPEQIELIE